MDNEFETIDLTYIWEVIKRHWRLITTLFLLSIIVSAFLSLFVLKPEYEAIATIIVQSQNSNNQLQYNDVMASQKIVKTYGEIIKSNQIAEDVINKLGLNITPEALLGKVKVNTPNESLVTSVTVTDNDPNKAVAIANGFAESFNSNIGNIMKIDNVKILDLAKLKGTPTPVRPKPLINIAIAGILGLMLGSGLSFLLEFLDKTIKYEQELEEVLGLPVLGVIANFDNGLEKKHKSKQFSGGKKVEFKGDSQKSSLPA